MGNRKYAKLLIGFFIAMLVLTLLSRAADSVTIAKVSATPVKQGTLAFPVHASGKILATDQVYVRGEKGTFIQKVLVGEGQRVKAGDVLFMLDMGAVAEKLLAAKSELASLRLNLKKAQMDSQGSLGVREAVENARRILKRVESDRDFNTELNGGQLLLADKRAVEDAQAALRTAEKQLAEEKVRNGISLEFSRLEIQEKEEAVKKLQKVFDSSGQVVAETAGTVGSLTATAGREVTGETLCTLVPDGARYIFEAELGEEEAKHMKIGDEVSITLEGKKVPQSGLFIRSLGAVEGKAKVTVEIPAAADAVNGMTASMSHRSMSQSYSNTIPLGALRGSEGEYFVLILKERGTVLGRETTAERVDVKVLEKDTKRAVLQDSVDGKVIQSSNKPIEAGDRVREIETGD